MGQLHLFKPGTPRRKPGKAYYDLAQTPAVKVELQVVEEGGENRMHSHPNLDGVWYVVSGRARFYDENDRPIEVGAGEGVVVPHDTKYWFEAAGDDALHVFGRPLTVGGTPPIISSERPFHCSERGET